MLTDREQQIVDLLRRDPLLSPAALADELKTTRSAVNVHLSNLSKKGVILGRSYVLADRPGVVVVGGSNMDIKARSASVPQAQTSNPGHASMTPGGVGRNVAETLARLGDRVHLVSVVGRDALGSVLIEHTMNSGVRTELVVRTDRPTGTYTAVLDHNGELVIAIADMEAIDELGPENLVAARDTIAGSSLVVVDGNLRPDTLDAALAMSTSTMVILDPVSVPKAAGISEVVDARVYAVTPGRDELAALAGLPTRTDRQVRKAADALHARGIEIVWVSLGADGSLLSVGGHAQEVSALKTDVVDVTGAGDSMLAGFCHTLLTGGSPQEAASLGHAAAALTVASSHTVRPDLSIEKLESMRLA